MSDIIPAGSSCRLDVAVDDAPHEFRDGDAEPLGLSFEEGVLRIGERDHLLNHCGVASQARR